MRICVYFKLPPLNRRRARHCDSCFHIAVRSKALWLPTPAGCPADLPGHVVDDRGEVGGAVQAHRLETLVVGLHHALDATAVRVLWVAVLKRTKKRHEKP